jgi:hypothetical protein
MLSRIACKFPQFHVCVYVLMRMQKVQVAGAKQDPGPPITFEVNICAWEGSD